MHTKPAIPNRSIARLLGRAFWAVMLLAHAPALASAWRSCFNGEFRPELLGGCAFLTASVVFFALKLRDVEWLRFSADRRAIVAMGLVVALIHLDCLRPGLRTEVVSSWATILVTTTVVVAGARLARSASARNGASAKSRLPDGRCPHKAWLDSTVPHCWVLAANLFRLRAPPA